MWHNKINIGDVALNLVVSPIRRERYLVKFEGERIMVGGEAVLEIEEIKEAGWGGEVRRGRTSFYILPPAPEDFPVILPRGAQIITVKDASRIISMLGVRSGMRVLEGGSGSGHMTSYLAWHLAPEGVLYSYERSAEHLKVAKESVRKFGLERWVEFREADVAEVRERDLQGALLDIPDPERVIPAVKDALRPGSCLVCYLPTVNQLERAKEAMEDAGFVDLKAVELLEREMSLREGAVRPEISGIKHTAYLLRGRLRR